MTQGPSTLVLAPVGPEGQWLSVSISFGTSMLPFLPPGKEVHTGSVLPQTIRIGDIITFQNSSRRLISHRVVKIVKHRDEIVFLTKGDNRLALDSLVLKHQLIGKVTRIGNLNLEQPLWRGIGRLIAWISYGQAWVYQSLAKNRLNKFRHAVERKGWFPRFRLSGGFRMVTNPLIWINKGIALRQAFEIFKTQRVLVKQGIKIRTWSPEDVEAMTQIWNESFPSYKTTVERLHKKLCQSPWFDPSGCFLVERASNVMGWTFGSLRSQDSTAMPTNRRGYIEVLALREPGWKAQADRVLLHEVLGWLEKKGARQLSLGPQLVPSNLCGISFDSFFTAPISVGFELITIYIELMLSSSRYRPCFKKETLKNISFGPWQEHSDAPLRDFLERHSCLQAYSRYQHYRKRAGSAAPMGDLIAMLEGQIVGFCRCLRDDQVEDYSEVMWAWSIASPQVPRGYFFHLVVDQKHRGMGIGPQLALKAFDSLFKAGCEEIRGVVSNRNGFYRRCGVQRNSKFVVLSRNKNESL